MIEANLTTAAEQLTVMDFFFYGRKNFSEEELAFVKSKFSPLFTLLAPTGAPYGTTLYIL